MNRPPYFNSVFFVFTACRVALVICFWQVCPAEASFAAREPARENHRVITKDNITQAGITRLTDILFMVDSWFVSTTDGYTYKTSPNGLTTWQKQRWIVLIDGQRADVDMFDAVNLNMLPISVDQIDSVVVMDRPGLYSGFFADAGLIHFFTTPPPNGSSMQATLSGGNETGDPGPYRYTELRTPNIDSMGPDGSFTFAFGRDRWKLRTNLTYQIHYFTDFAIQRRTFDIIGVPRTSTTVSPVSPPGGLNRASAGLLNIGANEHRPGMHRYTGSAGLVFENNHNQHEMFLGYSKAEKYFQFSEPLGREFPSDIRYYQLGINGRFGPSPVKALDYRVQYSSHTLSRHKNTMEIAYNWNQRRLVTDAEAFRSFERVRVALGGGYELRSIDTPDSLEDNPGHFGKLYGTIDLNHGGRFNHHADLMAFFNPDSPSLKARWNTSATFGARHTLTGWLSWSQRSFAENGDLWYWMGRGYSFADSNGIYYTMPGEIDMSNTGTADLTWRSRPLDKLVLDVTGIYRTFSDLYLESREYEYIPDSCSVTSATTVVPGNGGQLAGGSADLTWRLSPRLDAGASYRYLGTIAGDELFKDVWRTVPDHRFSGRLAYRPVEGFSIWARIWYYSSTYWKAYESLEGTGCLIDGLTTRYSPRIDDFSSVDITLRKLFWHRKLAADLAVRNLFDSEVRYHPIGADFGLTFFFQLSLVLPAP